MGQCYSHLNAAEREEISCGLALDWSCRAIARQLQRNVSTISSELKHHAAHSHLYQVAPAQRRAERHARRPRRAHKLRQSWLARYVQTALFAGWSPQQIAACLNNHPRKTPDWMTPNEVWAAQLQSLNVALGA